MEKKNTLLVIVLLALVSVYIVFFTSWFRPHVIKLFYTTRHISHFRPRADLPYVCFILGGKYHLTEVKVVSVDALKKNPDASPVWHLISDSNSVPVTLFVYGEHIHGLRPKIRGEQPQDLETNQEYRLFVSASGARGQMDFVLK